ncbi:MAG: SiaB family protein kinase [Bacteroidales bacterium]|nr:SiaB family protein kinase [Bacteroidales bacterium]
MLKFEQHRSLQIDDWLNDHYKGQLVYAYKGSISAEIVSQCLEKIEQYLQQQNSLTTKPKTVVHIAIELLQNIFHHSLPYFGVEKFGAVKIVHLPNGLQMEFLNVITKDKAILLYERIQQLNVLSKDELKKLHLLILSNNEYSTKGGGGLGLVDVARKLNTKLLAEFYPFEKNNYLYLLKIHLI